ncbi:MAG: ion transporter [Planctomycetota bacterium]|nr:MAG: ion transporter [Planctomycetota bacterium]
MRDGASEHRHWFEIVAQLAVLYSIVVFHMESEIAPERAARASGGFWLWNERILLTFFSLEYCFRWARSKNPWRYPFTLLSVIDLLAIVPTAFGLVGHFRPLKLLRVLPLLWMFKLYRYNRALQNVLRGFRQVWPELAVVSYVALIVLLASAFAMHEFEGPAQPEKFGHMFDAIWWSFVTLTTVGYGDLAPITVAGRLVAIVTMLIGIGILGTFLSLIGSSFLATMRGTPADGETRSLAIDARRPADAAWPQRRAG